MSVPDCPWLCIFLWFFVFFASQRLYKLKHYEMPADTVKQMGLFLDHPDFTLMSASKVNNASLTVLASFVLSLREAFDLHQQVHGKEEEEEESAEEDEEEMNEDEDEEQKKEQDDVDTRDVDVVSPDHEPEFAGVRRNSQLETIQE